MNPFHTEVGYWLWDAADQQVMRCFVVPRGSTIIAGGTAAAGDRRFTMTAAMGSPTYGILSNRYLDRAARCTRYECTVSVDDAVLEYDETTTIELAKLGETFAHVDRNVLRRVSE